MQAVTSVRPMCAGQVEPRRCDLLTTGQSGSRTWQGASPDHGAPSVVRRRIARGEGLISPFVGEGVLAVVHGVVFGRVTLRWGNL